MKSHVKTICILAVTFALTAVLTSFSFVFFIPVLFTCVTRDWKISLVEGLFFGVLSLCYSFGAPTPVATAFTRNPWMPILPRLVSVLGCHGLYVLLRKATKNKEGKVARVLPVIVACGAGSLLNTATVVPCLILFGGTEVAAAVLVTQTMIAAAIEFGVALLVVPPLAVTVGRALRLPDYKNNSELRIQNAENNEELRMKNEELRDAENPEPNKTTANS